MLPRVQLGELHVFQFEISRVEPGRGIKELAARIQRVKDIENGGYSLVGLLLLAGNAGGSVGCKVGQLVFQTGDLPLEAGGRLTIHSISADCRLQINQRCQHLATGLSALAKHTSFPIFTLPVNQLFTK
ncbi:hypothetical protein ES707_09026 [subsurface metagenome]